LNAYATDTLADLGIKSLDKEQTERHVFELLGHFTASHWMDSSLQEEFYLKGFDWLSGKQNEFWIGESEYMKDIWRDAKLRLELNS